MTADDTIRVTFSVSGTLTQEQALTSLRHHQPDELRPVREPSAYKGQSHRPGLFWISKLGRLVSYESRLEMIILKQLDFDRDLCEVLPQPIVLHFTSDGKRYRHIPDYLAWRASTPPELINVKPRKYTGRERNQRAFSACKAACAEISWTYSTQCEPPATVLANLNWLGGYRRQPPQFARYAPVLAERAATPAPIAVLVEGLGVPSLVRPVLFHLLWIHQLQFDLHQTLSDSSIVSLAV